MAGILGTANLANNIASATKGLLTAFGLANPEPSFPQFPDQGITSSFQREHWYKNPSQGLYSFSVEPVGKAGISEYPDFIENIASLFGGIPSSFGGSGESFFDKQHFGEFKLPITPQEITQTEDFAVSIKPTQGGTVVNHSGNRYKTLTVSGTTGVQPNRGLLGVYKGNGLAIGKPDELAFRSGYEVFQHFRQWMRAYHENKSKAGSEALRMVFRNYKDWEFLYVEPIKFTMKRDAAKPLLYNYMLQFRVIGVLTIQKPIFDFIVSKLNDISVAVVNSYVLIKKNKSVTETITGVINDFEESLNNLKFALKAANKEDLKLAEFTKSDAKKLSFKETLQLLGVIGKAIVQATTDQKSAEQMGAVPVNSKPLDKGQDLLLKANNPSKTDSQSSKAELLSLLDKEPALLTNISLDKLPKSIKSDLSQKQASAALISRIQVENLRSQAQGIQNKLAEGVGLGDEIYNQIFGLSAISTSDLSSEVTDDQFEMMYALSRTVNGMDGILASDEMFDKNAATFKKSTATNGADSIGRGIFSFPNPNGSVKEGFLPAGVTLEDLALSELGDSSRWTEIAELNGLKAPYIVDSEQSLKENFDVESINYSDPTQIRDLQITFKFLVPDVPIPTGAWSGRENNIAEYLGGDRTSSQNWRFIYPDEGTLIKVTPSQDFFRFENGEWVAVASNELQLDGVLRPGDKIKIPTPSAAPVTSSLQGPRDNRYTNSLSKAEQALAVDLKLNDQMDLDLTPSGDLNVAFGIENAAQAIVLKLFYEKGSLKKFPDIGTTITPGKKFPDIATLRADVTTSLLQDPRIKNVTKVNIIQENNSLSLSFEVLFNNISQPVPVTIPV